MWVGGYTLLRTPCARPSVTDVTRTFLCSCDAKVHPDVVRTAHARTFETGHRQPCSVVVVVGVDGRPHVDVASRTMHRPAHWTCPLDCHLVMSTYSHLVSPPQHNRSHENTNFT